MYVHPIVVLLVGESIRRASQMHEWLGERGCDCQFAGSFQDACDLISEEDFDLVISEYQLPDRSAFPLLELLDGSPSTLLFSGFVDDSWLWLLMMDHGERCVGEPLLGCADLVELLDETLLNTTVRLHEVEVVN